MKQTYEKEGAPGAQKDTISFEDWDSRIKPALDLRKAAFNGHYVVRKQEFYKDNAQKEIVTVYEPGNIESLKDLPGFEDLYKEYREQLEASVGGDVTAYSDIYEQIHNRAEEIEKRYEDLRKTDPLVLDVLAELNLADKIKSPTLQDVKEAIQRVTAQKEKREYDSAEQGEYLDLRWPVEGAFDGMKAEATLGAADKEAQKRGFSSRQEMWRHDLDKIKEFRRRIGEERFNRWEGVGGGAGSVGYKLDRLEEGK